MCTQCLANGESFCLALNQCHGWHGPEQRPQQEVAMPMVFTLIGIESRDKKPAGVSAIVPQENIVIYGEQEPSAKNTRFEFASIHQATHRHITRAL